MFCISRLAFLRFTFHCLTFKNIRNMYAVSTNLNADILHFNNKHHYEWNELGVLEESQKY